MFMHFELSVPAICLDVVRRLFFVAMAISAVQMLVANRAFASNGIFAWEIMKRVYNNRVLRYPSWSLLFNRRGFVLLNLALLALLVYAFLSASLQPAVMTPLFLLHCLIYIRSFAGMTGSDQMNTIVLFHLLLCSWFPATGFISLSLCSIAAQSILCYGCGGLIKLLEPGWFDGSCVREVLSTGSYGHPRGYKLFMKLPSSVQRGTGIFILGWELGFVLAPFMPSVVLVVYLCIGILFHIVNALVMGLNGFLWTFTATYPAIWFLHCRIDAWRF